MKNLMKFYRAFHYERSVKGEDGYCTVDNLSTVGITRADGKMRETDRIMSPIMDGILF